VKKNVKRAGCIVEDIAKLSQRTTAHFKMARQPAVVLDVPL
jgi:hypothetical protein